MYRVLIRELNHAVSRRLAPLISCADTMFPLPNADLNTVQMPRSDTFLIIFHPTDPEGRIEKEGEGERREEKRREEKRREEKRGDREREERWTVGDRQADKQMKRLENLIMPRCLHTL